MKIKLVIEDKEMYVDIPIKINELGAIWHLGFMLGDDTDVMETMKLNKMDKDFWEVWKKIEFAINDVFHKGKTFSSKEVKGKMKFVENKKRWYMVKKPKWRKNNGNV